MLDFDELQEFPKMSSWATKSDFIRDLIGTQKPSKNLVDLLSPIAGLSPWQLDYYGRMLNETVTSVLNSNRL